MGFIDANHVSPENLMGGAWRNALILACALDE